MYFKYLPILCGLLVSVIFGFSFIFTKEALSVISTFHLLGFRFAIATLLLTILNIMGIIKLDFKEKNIRLLFLLSFFQPVIYFICETVGIRLTTSSEAGMMIALIPVSVTILAAIFLNERPALKQIGFIISSVVGVLFIIVMKGSLKFSGQLGGILFLLGAVLSAGFYNILSRKSSLEFKPVEITYVMMWIGALFFNGVAIIQHLNQGQLAQYFAPLRNSKVLMAIIYLGILSSVAAFFMVNFMLSKLEPYQSAVFTNFTTVVSIVAGVVFRGEPFYWFHLVGALLILIGVWGTNYYGVSKEVATG
ncbi:DMT family transporter [Halanaerocella petrolearia]